MDPGLDTNQSAPAPNVDVSILSFSARGVCPRPTVECQQRLRKKRQTAVGLI